MTHDELRAAAERVRSVATGDLLAVMDAYLASGWRQDFANCPRDRRVMIYRDVLRISDGMSGHECVSIGYWNPSMTTVSHWQEFIPPTTRKDGE